MSSCPQSREHHVLRCADFIMSQMSLDVPVPQLLPAHPRPLQTLALRAPNTPPSTPTGSKLPLTVWAPGSCPGTMQWE